MRRVEGGGFRALSSFVSQSHSNRTPQKDPRHPCKPQKPSGVCEVLLLLRIPEKNDKLGFRVTIRTQSPSPLQLQFDIQNHMNRM